MATLGASLAGYVTDDAVLGAITLTGALLAARYLMDSVLAPVLGWSFDRLGFVRATLSNLLVGGMALLLASTGPGLVLFVAAILTFFATGTALQAGVAGTASKLGSGAYARYVTASDLGAATGPLLGWVVVALFNDPFYSLAIGGACFLLGTAALLLHVPTDPTAAAS
jgi:hypothetical protein